MPSAPADTRNTALTTFTIKVDGEPLPGTTSVVAVDITRALNRIPTAHLVIYDGDAAKQEFEISSSDLLLPGKTLEIIGGYNRDETLLFKGIITGQRIKVRRKGESTLHITARDAAFRLTLDCKSQYFTELTDSDLFADIITAYTDLTVEMDDTTITYPEIVQFQVTDWDFIIARAEKVGLLCHVDNGTLRIAPPDPAQTPALTLAYGQHIFNLDLELDARTQASMVTTLAWDQANQETIRAEVDDVPSPAQGNLNGAMLAEVGQVTSTIYRHDGDLPQQELDAWANAGMMRSRFSRIRGTLDCQGHEAVVPGSMVELKGLGDRFNGPAFVSGVRHMLGDGDWVMGLQIGLSPEWHAEQFGLNPLPAGGYNPTIHGLHIGVCTQLQDDPAGEERILVRLPLISDSDEGTWCRLAAFDAGSDRGAVFRPEIGDELIVGFIDNNPHEGIVLGMLHSSGRPAPLSASDDNHEKGLVTRSGLKMIFNDDVTSLTIETPAGKKLLLDDTAGTVEIADETGNTLTMNSDGITLESAKNITLKAQADITVEGINVNAKASATATLEGSASATLNSGGTTDVKGALVKIN